MSDRPEKSVLASFRSRLGKVPDQQIADLAKVSRTLVVNYRKKLGIPAYQGHKTSAQPATPAAADTRPFRGRRSALDAHVALLGKVPDAEVAKLAGVTAENVRTYRHRRGILALWQPETGVAAPSPAPAATPSVPAEKAARRAQRTVAAAAEVAAPVAPPAPEPVVVKVSEPVAIAAADAPAAQPSAPATDPTDLGTAYVVVVETAEGQRTYALVAPDIAAAALAAAARVTARHPGGSIRSIQRVAEVFPA